MSEILQYAKRNYSDEPFTAVSVEDLLEELKASVGEDCTANGITLVTETKKLTCRAQRNALQSVLFNLVFNAIEHTQCDRISVTAKKCGTMIRIDVADNGNGIESDKDIFSPFCGNGDDEQNSGLGLFIVKSHIEAMGGSISYTASNAGCVFTVLLLREI